MGSYFMGDGSNETSPAGYRLVTEFYRRSPIGALAGLECELRSYEPR